MKLVLVNLLVGAIWCAPPIEPDPVPALIPKEESTTIFPVDTVGDKDEPVTIINSETTEAATEEAVTEGVPTIPPLQNIPPRLSAKEREALISHLTVYDLSNVDPLVLTPRQQQAIVQELEHKKLGLAPFQDPTPWQRLTRDQQEEFNRKYLALRQDLQEYSRNQFLALPEERQEHAYNAFLSVDIQTLSVAIERELLRENGALQQRFSENERITEQQRFAEQQRLKKQQSIAEQQRLVEQQKRVEQQRIVEQQRLIEQQNFAEQQQLAEQQRLVEQKTLAVQERLAEQKIAELLKETKVEQKRQQEIQHLFEATQSQQKDWIEVKEQPRNQAENRLKTVQGRNDIEGIQFQHFKPVNKLVQQKQQTQSPPKSLISTSFKEKRKSLQFSPKPFQKSSRELQREQKRLNIRRLMFDPRRKQ